MRTARRKTSPIYSITREELASLIEKSSTVKEVLAFFGLKNKGGNFNTLKRRCIEENLSTQKFSERKGRFTGRRVPVRPLEEVMVENSDYHRGCLKRRLIADGILENKCDICGCLPEWLGQLLVLILDHKNGISDDHRLENLRLVCPNCNSQTTTFAGKNVSRLK